MNVVVPVDTPVLMIVPAPLKVPLNVAAPDVPELFNVTFLPFRFKSPATVRGVLLALVHVWFEPSTTGAVNVNGGAEAATVNPADGFEGVNTKLLVGKTPGATVYDVTPEGEALNVTELITYWLSSVVFTKPVPELLASKITSDTAPGVTPALVKPAASVVQLLRPEV